MLLIEKISINIIFL